MVRWKAHSLLMNRRSTYQRSGARRGGQAAARAMNVGVFHSFVRSSCSVVFAVGCALELGRSAAYAMPKHQHGVLRSPREGGDS